MMTTQASLEGIFGQSQKIPLSWTTFIAYILPPQACLYLMGVLVQLRGTRFYRLALLPVLVWLAWRGIFVDMSGGNPMGRQKNAGLVSHMFSISLRATVWALAREPFKRQNHSNKRDKPDSESAYAACWNAWDLMASTRGIEWNWPQGFVAPKPVFETESRIVFVLLSAARMAFCAFGLDVCLQTIRSLSPDTFGSLDGGSLFDHTLPPLLELVRSVSMGFMAIWMTYFGINLSYQALAIVCIVFFWQQPSQCPPLFDSPWLSASLSELWGRRWHQMMRELLMPFNYLFGQLGGVFCAFLLSGVFHDVELRAFGQGGDSVAVIGFWVMNGVGVVLERLWKRSTGRRVGGVLGRIWTFGWLALWGVPMVNAYARAGRFAALGLPGNVEPSVAVVKFVRSIL